MAEYKSNSHRSKEQSSDKKVEKVISGNAKVKKRSALSDDIQNIKSYVVMDVLIPAAKKAISDIVTNSIDMILYPGGNGRPKRSNANHVSYRSYYDNIDRDRRYDPETRSRRSSYSYDDIIIDTRAEAEEVLERMDELLDTYNVVSVADLYDLVGISCSYTDNKYGWTNLRNAEVIRVRDGYFLKLPKVGPID